MNEGYAIFLNDDGTETKLSWDKLKLEENGKKYKYRNDKNISEIFYMNNFDNCYALKELSIPENVRYFGSLFHCLNLKKFSSPNKFVSNHDYPFLQINGNNAFNKIDLYIKDPTPTELKESAEAERIIEEIERETTRDGYSRELFENLNLRNSNGERYFDIFELNDYYQKCEGIEEKEVRIYPEDGDGEHYWYETRYEACIDYWKASNNVKQIVRYSEGLGIKPDLSNNVDKLREQYIEKLETQNKANQEYISKLEKEFLAQKEKENERDNMPVHERD